MQARRLLAVVCAVAFLLGLGPAALAEDQPDPLPIRIMFVGDSLTGSPGCWRAPVWASLTDDAWDVDMVGINTVNGCGDVTNAAGVPWDPDNTGIGGVTATRMWIKLAQDGVLEEYEPQVIVQVLGTNDLLGGADADAILAQYDKLLELYREYDPGIEVVVGTPPPLDSGVCGCEAEQAALATSLRQWAIDNTTDDSVVTFANLSSTFDPATDTDDGIHPNDAGNAKLAAAITPQIVVALNAATVVPTDAAAPATPSAVWFVVGILLFLLAIGAFVAWRNRS